MYKKKNICIVIPYYKASAQISGVINSLPDFVDRVIVVDDNSPEALPQDLLNNKYKLTIVKLKKNLGVGGATIEGFRKALQSSCDIVVKMDSDGQMDPQYLPSLLDALIVNDFGYSKGNRFFNIQTLKEMPFARRMGNLVLSFLVKATTGYWNNFDPTNGYFAIKKDVLKKIDLNNLSNRYFFETSLLAELYFYRVAVADIPMPSIYRDEKSNMKVWKMPFVFLPRLFRLFIRRIVLEYFLFDFNIASMYILFGVPLFLFGVIFGILKWHYYASINTPAPTGTVMIAVLSLILGFQLILQAIQYDIQKAPKSQNR